MVVVVLSINMQAGANIHITDDLKTRMKQREEEEKEEEDDDDDEEEEQEESNWICFV